MKLVIALMIGMMMFSCGKKDDKKTTNEVNVTQDPSMQCVQWQHFCNRQCVSYQGNYCYAYGPQQCYDRCLRTADGRWINY